MGRYLISFIPIGNKMSKISIILFGLLVALAVLASAENEEQSLAEKLSSLRVARDADPGRRNKNKRKKSKKSKKSLKSKKNKKSKKNRKSKKGMKSKKNKKTRKNKKSKKNRKSKKNKKSKRKNNKSKKQKKNKKRTNKGSRTQGRMVDANCLATAATTMKRW